MASQKQRRWLVGNVPTLLRAVGQLAPQSSAEELHDWILHRDPTNPLDHARIRARVGKAPVFSVKRSTEPGEREIVESELANPGLVDSLGEPHLVKTRLSIRSNPGLTVDIYRRPAGIAIIEQTDDPDERLGAADLPDWLGACGLIEVTNLLSSASLAAFPERGQPEKTFKLVRESIAPKLPTIVLTGAPCSGKTRLINELDATGRFVVLPEAATLVMSKIRARPTGDPDHDEQFQRGLRDAQLAFETIGRASALALGREALVTDRASNDSQAYIPGGRKGYFNLFGIYPEIDALRYRGVIQLALPSREIYERHRADNPERRESYDEAKALETRLIQAWSHMDKRYAYIQADTWEEKRRLALERLERFLAPNT